MSAPDVPLCWWGAACNLSASTLQRSYPLRGFHAAWRRHDLQFSVLDLRSSRPVLLDRAVVSRAVTATTLRRDGLLIQR